MKTTRLVILFAVAAVMLFGGVVAASAKGSGGVVYGRAEMQPLVSIAISGPGSSSDNPLQYYGRPSEHVGEYMGRTVTVSNTGQEDVTLELSPISAPSNGAATWAFSEDENTPGADTCIWYLSCTGHAVVPASGVSGLDPELLAGDSVDVTSGFVFPTNYTGGPFDMSALITPYAISK